MNFTINKATPEDLAKLRQKLICRAWLTTYKFGIAETKLDQHLKATYKIELDTACKLILEHAVFSLTPDRRIVVLIRDHKLDNLAKLITYGTGRIQGSKILRKVFGQFDLGDTKIWQ